MATSAQVQQLYIALLGRAADKPGLDWWLENINGTEGVPGERTLEQAAAAFTTSEEFLSTYGSLQGAELVTAVYKNLFERTPSQDEVNYWVNDGRPADELLQAFLTYASPADQAVIDNKVFVAEAYSNATGDDYNLDAAAQIVADVNGTAASVSAALNNLPTSTATLTEALAIIAEGGELPEGYTLSDTALVLEAGTIAAIGEQIAAAQAVVDGAANAEELEFAPEFAIEDSAENVLAAAEENPLVADISLITLTDETITAAQRDALVELGFDAEALSGWFLSASLQVLTASTKALR